MGGRELSRKRTRDEETIPLLLARQQKADRLLHDAESAVHPLTELFGLLQAAAASQQQQFQQEEQAFEQALALKKPPLAPRDKSSPKCCNCSASSSVSSSSSSSPPSAPLALSGFSTESSASSSSTRPLALASTNPGLAMYGTMSMSVSRSKQHPSEAMDVSPEQVSPTSCSQSETESDSDGSCPPTVTRAALEEELQKQKQQEQQQHNGSLSSSSQVGGVLQSILRLKNGKCGSCGRQKKKKSMSVEFALDLDDLEAGKRHPRDLDTCASGNSKRGRRLQKSESAPSATSWRYCATSRCMPRRLTLEEKLELYRVRPDLEINPAPLLLHELEERQRRRQRKLMFSILGATLVCLLVIVFYSLFSQF